ncbi:hypothetical protein CAC42_5460 [Sphaceloma murrayae]|uniref:Uncharacterized protein n=1 Tax=Sphaceloma murrayae TaxID=2082308 RepID=A0A2K1QK60_9PEZI|nr:hypothetical protein CAC42_5460 [Sphaceloma murrayae]
MEEDGSRYRNLESRLGEGATLALGTKLGESYWKKFLPKSRIDSFVEMAKDTRLPQLSTQYAPLRKELVKYYLHELQIRLEPQNYGISPLQSQAMDEGYSADHVNAIFTQTLDEASNHELWSDMIVDIGPTLL